MRILLFAAITVIICVALCGCRDRVGLLGNDEPGAAVAVFGNAEENFSFETDLPAEETVFITPTGKVYHTTRICQVMRASNEILTVTRGEAALRGITAVCRYCG